VENLYEEDWFNKFCFKGLKHIVSYLRVRYMQHDNNIPNNMTYNNVYNIITHLTSR